LIPKVGVIKPFFSSSLMLWQSKLECLSMEGFFGVVCYLHVCPSLLREWVKFRGD